MTPQGKSELILRIISFKMDRIKTEMDLIMGLHASLKAGADPDDLLKYAEALLK